MNKRMVCGVVLAGALCFALSVSGCGPQAEPTPPGGIVPESPYPGNQPPGPPGGTGTTPAPGGGQ